MHYASEMNLRAAKRVLRYIKATHDYGVKFVNSENFKLSGFLDSEWVGSIDEMKVLWGTVTT